MIPRFFARAALLLAILAPFAAAPTMADAPVEWDGRALTDIHGAPFDASRLEGRVVLLVNTASHCAFTGQYEDLESVWRSYSGAGLTVLGVPSNDFGGQEPGSNEEIAEFCSQTYDVSFPMLQKSPVTGPSAHPLFAWARQEGGTKATPAWNFHKILVGRDGRLVAGFPSYLRPTAPDMVAAIRAALATPAF